MITWTDQGEDPEIWTFVNSTRKDHAPFAKISKDLMLNQKPNF